MIVGIAVAATCVIAVVAIAVVVAIVQKPGSNDDDERVDKRAVVAIAVPVCNSYDNKGSRGRSGVVVRTYNVEKPF